MAKIHRWLPMAFIIVAIGMGGLLIVWGLLERQWGTAALGAGLLGLPGVRESLKAVSHEDSSTPAVDSVGAVGV